MDKAKIFMNGKSQAVRLPKKYRFDTDEVLIQEHPEGVLLIDPKKRFKNLLDIINEFPDDVFNEPIERLPWTKREDL